MTTNERVVPELLSALHFAASKHRDQRRKDAASSPYINHLIAVAELLARVGGVGDPVALMAAALHDTVEDTETTFEEIERTFGAEVRSVVAEVSDDKGLPKQGRKRLQIEHAPHLSERARLVKLADKISNVRDLVASPPSDWSDQRVGEYFDWAEAVVAAMRTTNRALEQAFTEALAQGRAHLHRREGGG